MFVDKETAQSRINHCKKCTNYTLTGQCSLCLCFMRLKVRMKNESCPDGKW
jgi:recombinational DNA repair protein RecR